VLAHDLTGDVERDEMRRVFNLGVGMVAAVPADAASTALDVLAGEGLAARIIGEVVPGDGQVRFTD